MHTEIKVACTMHAHTCMHANIKERKKNAHVPVTRWWIVQTFMHASIKERKKNLTCSSLIPNMLTKPSCEPINKFEVYFENLGTGMTPAVKFRGRGVFYFKKN